MIYVKTAEGQLALQTRSLTLLPRQRSAFIMFDGKRSVQDVIKATEGLGGVHPEDVAHMVGLGLLVPLAVEVFVTVTKRLVRALPVDLLCIAGGLVLRFCVVWSGMH